MDTILGVELHPHTKAEIVSVLKDHLESHTYAQIVSINPEILTAAKNDEDFFHIINSAEIKIIDGVGVILAASVLQVPVGERLTGVELMQRLVAMADKAELRVLLIGGGRGVAEQLAKKLQKDHQNAIFKGNFGYEDIKNPTSKEEEELQTLIKTYKPNMVFVAFGAPFQEKWIYFHKDILHPAICMGVGGTFDFLAGNVPRAPLFIQKIGLEWLFRLIIQPWRWKRQLKLLKFISLVIQERINRPSE